jgi:hypothetical protein
MATTQPTTELDVTQDFQLVKTESYNADIMEKILRDKRFAAKDLRHLSAYKKQRTHANQKEVVYHYARGMEKLKMGRLYARNNLGLQAFPHDIRNPLLSDNYVEIDMENAHYKFMVKLADNYNLKNDALKYYVNNRKACLDRVCSDRKLAKTTYLMTGYGGNAKLYSEFYENDTATPEGDLSQVYECKNEISFLVNAIWNDPKYKDIKKLACIKAKPQPIFSLFALVLQTEECTCLRIIDSYLKSKNRDMDIYIHDGGAVRKLPNEVDFPVSLLRGAEKVVYSETGHKITLAVKLLEHNFAPASSTGMILIDTDYKACIELKNIYEHNIVRASDNWYVNMPDTLHWEQGDEFVKNLIVLANFRKPTELSSVPYGCNASGCSNIFSTLCNSHNLFPLNENFVDEINMATKGRVYFNDKYWDLDKKDWFDIGLEQKPIYPLIYIKRNAPDLSNITQEEITDFSNNCLNMFKDDIDRNFFLRAMARALGGHIEDKIFYILKGLRDSGKGVLQEICMLAFGEYCAVYDIPMMKSSNSGDASDLRWVGSVKANLKRAGFCNETKNTAGKTELPADGNVIKKVIASGGDPFLTRNHYKGECYMKMNLTSFMFMNKIPTCNPADAMEKCIPFDMPFKFVEEEDLDTDPVSYRLANPNIKDLIKANGGSGKRWGDVFLFLLFEAYTPNKIERKDMNEHNRAELDSIKKEGDALNPILLFKNAFVKDSSGWVSSADIKEALLPANMSDVKLGTFLKDRGYIRGKKYLPVLDNDGNPVLDGDGNPVTKQFPGYKGISKLVVNDDNDNDI